MNNEITTLLEDNVKLRNQIASLMETIHEGIEDASPLSSCHHTEGITHILDDLPAQQQISLYQDSIAELKKQLKYKPVLEIESLENEKRGKLEMIHNLKTQHDISIKLIKEHKRILQSPPQSEDQYQMKFKSQKAKEAKLSFKEHKTNHKELLETIKKQNNAIYILEDNCTFIRENIEYKKRLAENDQSAFSFEDFDYKARQMEVLTHKQKEHYKSEIMKQLELIDSLSSEISELEMKLGEINKEIRSNELRMKQFLKQSFSSEQNHKSNINEGIDADVNDENALYNYKSLYDTQKLFDEIDKSLNMN